MKLIPSYKYPDTFSEWKRADYERACIEYVEPMLAKELDEVKQREVFEHPGDYYIEEKYDGTRGILHIFDDCVRCFSRRLSKKSDWLTENTDSLPQLRDLKVPILDGTILDGEIFIPGRPFKDVAAVMNCLPEEAVRRQIKLGKAVFHAFDILYYRGIHVEHMPLFRRKEYLKKAMKHILEAYPEACIEEVPYWKTIVLLPKRTQKLVRNLFDSKDLWGKYPMLEADFKTNEQVGGTDDNGKPVFYLTYEGFFQYVIATGGEGVIVKPINGRYTRKRGWEYSKIKKFLTKDVIVLGYTEPTEDYDGKFPTPDKWNYWKDINGVLYDTTDFSDYTKVKYFLENCPSEVKPINSYAFKGQIGNIRYGVVITQEEMDKLPEDKKFDIERIYIDDEWLWVVEVGECGGFDDDFRAELTLNGGKYLHTVMEVKANEIFKDTGKLRHPRFLRMRADKAPKDCTWGNHIGE